MKKCNQLRGEWFMAPNIHIYRLRARVKSTRGSLVHTPTHLCVCIRHSEELKPLPLIHPHVSVMGSELSMNHHQLAEPNSKCPSVEAEFQNENSARHILLVIFFSWTPFLFLWGSGWLACGLDWSGFDALLLWTLTLNLSLKPFEI